MSNIVYLTVRIRSSVSLLWCKSWRVGWYDTRRLGWAVEIWERDSYKL